MAAIGFMTKSIDYFIAAHYLLPSILRMYFVSMNDTLEGKSLEPSHEYIIITTAPYWHKTLDVVHHK
jgi:hypothetical protein